MSKRKLWFDRFAKKFYESAQGVEPPIMATERIEHIVDVTGLDYFEDWHANNELGVSHLAEPPPADMNAFGRRAQQHAIALQQAGHKWS